MKALISPSLLSADFSRLGEELEGLAQAGVPWLHLDVMDGSFVPNITFGAPLISSLRKNSGLFFDTHLMIEEPDRYVEDFARAGADLIVIHIEAARHPQRCLSHIRSLGLKAGISLNPGTDISLCRWLLPYMDMILVMGVNPGFSGQKFIPETILKVRECRCFLNSTGHNIPIQVDGGANLENAGQLVENGANILVSGSAFFRYGDYAHALSEFNCAIAKGAEQDDASRTALKLCETWKHCAQN